MTLKDVSILFLEKNDNLSEKIALLIEEEKIYEEAINDLETGYLSKISQKLLYDKYRIYLTKGNSEKMLNTLKTDLFVINEKLTILKRKKVSSLAVYNALSYRQLIKPNLMSFIRDELENYGLNDVEIMKINEKIKIHNSNIMHYQKNSLRSDDFKIILEMLNHGIEYYPKVKVDRSNDLDLVAAKLKKVIDGDPLSLIKDNLDLETMYQNIYSEEEIKYLYTELLRHSQNRLFDLIQVLKNKEYYYDIEALQAIKTDYKVLIEKILFLRDKINCLSMHKDENITYEQEKIVAEDVNKLYYSSNSFEPSKCYFMKDIESIREESLERIADLLDSFKKGETLNIKALSSNKKESFIEIKDDQIRIVLQPINNHLYSVMGVFIKKSDNLRDTYRNIFNRPVADVNDEFSLLVEEIFKDYVKENARKGTR